MSAPAVAPQQAPTNGPMLIRTLYSGDRLVIGELVVNSDWRQFSASDTQLILLVASEQRVQIQAMSPDGTAIQTPAGPMALQFYTDIEVGSVTTVPAGQPARVYSTGAPPELVFHFELPEGQRGLTGQQGFSPQLTAGAVNVLPPGSQAAANIYGPPTGMVLELSIPQGAKGDTGAAAAKQTFKIGTISTGAAGSSATAAIRADATDATGNTWLLDFTIPQGTKGDTGNVTNATAGGDLTGTYPNPTLSAAAKALFSPAGDAAAKISTHSAATDPHGDRAYADSKVGTNAADIAALKTAVYGATTRTKKPLLHATLLSDLAYTVGQGDVFAQNGWSRYTSTTDPTQVFISTAAGTYSYFMAPVAGRYWIHFQAIVYMRNRLGWAAATVTKDDRNVGSNSIAQDQQDIDYNQFGALDAMTEFYLTAGQKLYWAIWGTQSLALKSSYNGKPTKMTLTWMGPD